jgi:hypothetical protein
VTCRQYAQNCLKLYLDTRLPISQRVSSNLGTALEAATVCQRAVSLIDSGGGVLRMDGCRTLGQSLWMPFRHQPAPGHGGRFSQRTSDQSIDSAKFLTPENMQFSDVSQRTNELATDRWLQSVTK